MMLRFQALISPTAGVDGDATENRNQRGLYVRTFPASCLDGSADMQTIHMHIKKEKKKKASAMFPCALAPRRCGSALEEEHHVSVHGVLLTVENTLL